MLAQDFTDHTVICGLGELGRAICNLMLDKDPLARLVLVDIRENLMVELGLTEVDYPNVQHIRGDMTSKATLQVANCQKADLIIMTTGNDGHNLEADGKAKELNPQAQIRTRLHRSKVRQLICPTDKVRFSSPYERAAENFLSDIEEVMEEKPTG